MAYQTYVLELVEPDQLVKHEQQNHASVCAWVICRARFRRRNGLAAGRSVAVLVDSLAYLDLLRNGLFVLVLETPARF